MSNENEPITSPLPPALPQEGKKVKSPGRIAAAKRLNELGLRGTGGRRPVHGLRALQTMLARGEQPEGLAGQVLREHEQELARDFDARLSAKERRACRRLAELELYAALCKARLTTERGVLRRLPWRQEKEIIAVGVSIAEAYPKICAALGWKKRERDALDLARVIQAVQKEPDEGGGNGDGR